MSDKQPDTFQRTTVPHIYAEKMKTARSTRHMKGERRVVTILMCDVVESTAFAGNLDPEVWAEIMHEAFDYLVSPIYRYEGTVARMMGDGLLAFFGAPIAHEDDAERAVLAGLEILSTLEPFAQELEQEFGSTFSVRVGINTGAVVVGDIGSDLAMEYTAMGDAINVAARMEQTATPGALQIAEDTYQRIAPLFEFDALGPVDLKGKTEPVNAYRVIKPREKPGTLRGIEGLSAPLIGRTQELLLLQQLVEELNAGRGGIVTLLGEAGLGKSRLINELVHWTQSAQVDEPQWHAASGVSYNMALPFGVFRPMLRTLIDVDVTTPPSQIQKQTELFTDPFLEAQQASIRLTFQLVLGLEPDPDAMKMDAERIKREVFQGMDLILRHLVGQCPIVLVLDDLHWADPVSVELITHLFGLTDELPILFLCSLRPHRNTAGWQVKLQGETHFPHRYGELSLQPLTSEDSERLIAEILTVSNLPTHLHQLILSKAEGNPFFVEEVIRMLIEQHVVVRDEQENRWVAHKDPEEVIIPDNLNALLTARIDRLPVDVRNTLQYAAVIGRSFQEHLLAAVSSQNGNLQDHLSILQRSELIRETSRLPEVEYSFHHELTRDAAYNTVLRRQRQRYHRQVGEALERLYADRHEEFAARFGYHFERAGVSDKAISYYTMAGDQAARLYANEEAIEYYRRALDCAREKDETPDNWINLLIKLGRVYEVSGRYPDALLLYQDLVELGIKYGDAEVELEGLLHQVTIYSVPTIVRDRKIAKTMAERALALAEKINDPESEAKTLWNMLLQDLYLGYDYENAVSYGEWALKLARQHDLKDLLPYILNDLARAYSSNHQSREAFSAQQESEAIWREQGNIPMLADNLTTAADLLFGLGELERAAEFAEEALQISQEIENLWGQAYSLMVYGGILVELGQISRGIHMLEESERIGREGNFVAASMFVPIYLAWIYASLGAVETALDYAHQSIESMKELPVFQARAHVIMAKILALHGDLPEAMRMINASSELLESVIPDLFASALVWVIVGELRLENDDIEGAMATVTRLEGFAARSRGMWCIPDVLLLKARILFRMGKKQQAIEALHEAKAEADRLGSHRSNLLIRAAMAKHLLPTWDAAQVKQFDHEAKTLVDQIEHEIDKDDLRKSFRQSEPVKTLLG
jgi:class 3 adenylate cyclase/tetratricopeptide (TPR) repeat protein